MCQRQVVAALAGVCKALADGLESVMVLCQGNDLIDLVAIIQIFVALHQRHGCGATHTLTCHTSTVHEARIDQVITWDWHNFCFAQRSVCVCGHSLNCALRIVQLTLNYAPLNVWAAPLFGHWSVSFCITLFSYGLCHMSCVTSHICLLV